MIHAIEPKVILDFVSGIRPHWPKAHSETSARSSGTEQRRSGTAAGPSAGPSAAGPSAGAVLGTPSTRGWVGAEIVASAKRMGVSVRAGAAFHSPRT